MDNSAIGTMEQECHRVVSVTESGLWIDLYLQMVMDYPLVIFINLNMQTEVIGDIASFLLMERLMLN